MNCSRGLVVRPIPHVGRKRRFKTSSHWAFVRWGRVASMRMKCGGALINNSIKFCRGTTEWTLSVFSASKLSSEPSRRRMGCLHGFRSGSWHTSRMCWDTWLTTMISGVLSKENMLTVGGDEDVRLGLRVSEAGRTYSASVSTGMQ